MELYNDKRLFLESEKESDLRKYKNQFSSNSYLYIGNKPFRMRPSGEFTLAFFNSCVAMAVMNLQEKHLIGLALAM